ncbi:MAG TPA: hypothetical protein VLI54_02555 [Bacillota bacterium]|nr:hypothetical protein [Bacillota bacterium]
MENLDHKTQTYLTTGPDLAVHLLAVLGEEYQGTEEPRPVTVPLTDGTFAANPTTIEHPQTEGVRSTVTVRGIFTGMDGAAIPDATLIFEADDASTPLSSAHVALPQTA